MTTRVRARMPVIERPRPRGWWIGVFGLVVIALHVALDELVHWGEYLPQQIADAWQMLALMGCELVSIAWLWQARIRFSLGARAALVAGLSIVTMFPFGMGCRFHVVERAPGESHLTWLVLACLWSVMFSLGVTIDYVIGWWRRRSQIQPAP